MNKILQGLAFIIILSSVTYAQDICGRFRSVPEACDLNAPAAEQAKCLLRPVNKFANLGPPLHELPAPFDTLIGQTTEASVTLEQLARFLGAKGIHEVDIGGQLSVRLSKPKYFVIHDTSDFLELSDFPSNINDEDSSLNNLSRRVTQKVCHVYINRAGQSATVITFESPTPPIGTKFGRCHSPQRTDVLHIENIQPRIRDRSVKFSNDAIAPEPGFSEAQLERLALVYLVASVRSRKWLIPAYHAPIDLGFPHAHDDPQNFNLQAWAAKLDELIAEIRSQGKPGSISQGKAGF
jgi:hypothetical protein